MKRLVITAATVCVLVCTFFFFILKKKYDAPAPVSTSPRNDSAGALSHPVGSSDSASAAHRHSMHSFYHTAPDRFTPVVRDPETGESLTQGLYRNAKDSVPFKGTERRHTDFLFPKEANSREQIMIIHSVLQEGDYITGTELAELFRHDKTLSRLFRNAFSRYLEKNIRFLEKSENRLIIHTVQEEGVYTTFPIPFLKECSVLVKDNSSIAVGDVFVSSEPLFIKSYLLPLEWTGIQFIQNGEVVPYKGYVSGNYYFIDYAQSRTAYKIK